MKCVPLNCFKDEFDKHRGPRLSFQCNLLQQQERVSVQRHTESSLGIATHLEASIVEHKCTDVSNTAVLPVFESNRS